MVECLVDKDRTVEQLRDPEGLATLDAKILSAVPNIVSGDFARQVDTFKEREAHQSRLVRGRCVLLMMDRYFSTNALHGSVYDVEDLLCVAMVNEKLEVFTRNWGISRTDFPPPDQEGTRPPTRPEYLRKGAGRNA